MPQTSTLDFEQTIDEIVVILFARLTQLKEGFVGAAPPGPIKLPADLHREGA